MFVAGYLFLAIAAFSVVAYYVGRYAGASFIGVPGAAKAHSLPSQHGAFVAIWVGMPALVLLVLWMAMQGAVLDQFLLASLPPDLTAGQSAAQLNLVLSEVKNVAEGNLFSEPSAGVLDAADTLVRWRQIAGWAMVAAVAAAMLIALVITRSRLTPRFRARNHFEQVLSGLMILSSLIAVLTTAGIAASLIFEALRFFSMVPLHEFLFGLRWEPQIAMRADQVAGQGAFGAVPVFTGTLLISFLAMAVAVPVGLFTAVYLVEYANEPVRRIIKPLLEILAGVPTVVYGFFAVLTVAPAVRQAGSLFGIAISPNSALTAGLVMGVMIIPFISSISDDALRAVPRTMRDGSLALGATRSETMTKVLLPAALPGIMGGILLALSRAIGETMIVVMAAGLIATLTINPIDSVTTVTVQIVTLLIGDSEFDSPKTLAAFALGLMLFVITLVLNIVALSIVRRFREQYE